MQSPISCLTETIWLEAGENPENEHVLTSTHFCKEGEIRWCEVHSAPWPNWGRKCWLLYQMEVCMLNGINTPEELDALAIVEVEVLAVEPVFISDSGVVERWQVLCLRVIPLAAIPHRLPPLPPANPDDFRPYGKLECASENLYRYKWGTQVKETTIYVQEAAPYSPTHLVSYQLSIDNYCEIYNWPIK